ncbi:MAG: UbiA family prenyltransferase, partial [Bacteroidales bacterium]|nr:UbiA family prenyltransferase [Bacteroidales bacterium]
MLAILQSTRPRTLVLSVSSILTGTFLAREQGFFSWPLFIFLMLTSCLLQILSNLVNEYGDWKKGTDKEQPGRRALSLQSGKMTERQIITFIYIIGGLSLISGLALV